MFHDFSSIAGTNTLGYSQPSTCLIYRTHLNYSCVESVECPLHIYHHQEKLSYIIKRSYRG